ncbi:hypothetical protein llap_21702 [Limosa lapponica baueri]|uniref:Uncharacterized protein n=1 Tax=Limosa lapponica baueri TaxID=1758121 RepID=A0A2I0T2I0_LIMLA|nr:hypothetical protein llap_21702 [Limosa lapponica baueri]
MAMQRNVQKLLQLLFWGGWKLYGREQGNLLDVEGHLAQMRQILDTKELTSSASKRILEDQLSDLKCDLEGQETTLTKTQKERQV